MMETIFEKLNSTYKRRGNFFLIFYMLFLSSIVIIIFYLQVIHTVRIGFEHYSYEMSEFKPNKLDTMNL